MSVRKFLAGIRGSAYCAIIVVSNTAFAQIGLPPVADVHVRCEVIDPEVDEGANLMVWQEITQLVKNSAHAQRLNQSTGDLVGASGQIAADVSAYLFSQAGPKFSNGRAQNQDELYVVFSKRPVGQEEPDRSVGFVKYNESAFGCTTDITACFQEGGENHAYQPETRAIVYSTEEEDMDTEPARAIYRYRNEPDNADPINKLCWIDLNEWLPDDDGPETCFENDTVEWGRIKEIDGEQWIVTTIIDNTQKMQVVLVDLDNPNGPTGLIRITGLTNDPARFSDKFNPMTWYDPATQSYMLVLRQNYLNVQHSDIAIWQRQPNGQWTHFLTFNAVDIGEEMSDTHRKTFLLSPEPFVWGGRSYILFSSSDSLQQSTANDGNIWIMRVPTSPSEEIDFSRRLNDRPEGGQDERRRFEAESFVLRTTVGAPITPVVYYSMWEDEEDDGVNCEYSTGDPVAPFEFHTLRRAETGLTLP
jgi:hypothetical protein